MSEPESEIAIEQVYKVAKTFGEEFAQVISQAIKPIVSILDQFCELPPRYVWYETLHPRKKPRGSIRRRRREKRDNE